MKILRACVAGLLLLGSVGCSTAAPAGPAMHAVTSGATSESSGSSIRLQRSICFGRCPAYALTLHEDGTVEFAGELHVAINGASSGQADLAQVSTMFARLRSPEFLALADQYQPGDKACGRWATDMPSVKLDITLDGHARHIDHYTGCSAVPPLLSDIEKQVDSVSGSRRWIVGEDVR